MSIYLDNAATSFPKPEAVYQAVERALRRGGSPNRGMHVDGLEATRNLFDVRETVAEFVGAEDSSRIVFGFNATDCLNMALKGLIKEGDHVVSTDVEHNAVLRPLRALERQKGVKVDWVAANESGVVRPDDIVAAVKADTRLVVLTHSSNVLGGVNDIEAISEALSARGIPLLVDAAQTVGHIPIDVGRLGLAMLAAPGHKSLLGPQGTGFLWVHEEITLETWREGGTGTESRSADMPEAMPETLEAGTHNYPGLLGLAAGIQWLKEQGAAELAARKQEQIEALRAQIRRFPQLRIIGSQELGDRSPLVTFTHDGVDSEIIAGMLSRKGIAVRAGLHCAPGAHEKAGSSKWGAVRVSPGVFTDGKDIDVLGEALSEVLRSLP